MKRIISLLVAILLLCTTLVGCGEQNGLVGKWKTEFDYTNMMNELIVKSESDAEMAARHLKISNFTVVVYTTFKEDGTYEVEADREEFEKTLAAAKEDLKKGVVSYMEEYIADQGLSMTAEEAIEASGIDLQTYVDGAFKPTFVEEMMKALSAIGRYKAQDGKLYMSDGLDKFVDEKSYQTYELSGDELIILDSVTEDSDSSEEELPFEVYPVRYERVN